MKNGVERSAEREIKNCTFRVPHSAFRIFFSFRFN